MGDYTEWQRRRADTLADLRRKNAVEIEGLKNAIHGSAVVYGVAIGISPKDEVLKQFTRGEITHLINKIFKRMRIRGSDGTNDIVRPIAPLILTLVGEYSPKHRWHYHGLIFVKNIEILQYIKKRLTKVIGRTVTENIRCVHTYVDYMFKSYECDDHKDFMLWVKDDCYLSYQTVWHEKEEGQ